MDDEGIGIGDVASRTGVSTTLLRTWEQRYNLVDPGRTPSGQRRYTLEQVGIISRMRDLVDAGMPPRRAAAAVRDQAPPPPPVAPTATPLDDTGTLVRLGDDPEDLRRCIDEAFALGSFEYVVQHWLMPALVVVGEAWASGRIDVAQEHLTSTLVQHKLAGILSATPSHGPRVMVALPPGARHELPALAFATCLRRVGVDAVYFGADTPAEALAGAVGWLRPRAVVLAPLMPEDVPAARTAVDAIRAAGLDQVFVGGPVAREVPGGRSLPLELPVAATAMATLLGVRPRA